MGAGEFHRMRTQQNWPAGQTPRGLRGARSHSDDVPQKPPKALHSVTLDGTGRKTVIKPNDKHILDIKTISYS